MPRPAIQLSFALLTIAGCGGASSSPDLVWGKKGVRDGSFVRPRAAVIDRHDRLFIVDFTARIQAMVRALRDANLEPPSFDDRRASFLVTFRNHSLMNPEAVRWLNQFAAQPLNDRQRVALVYLRQHERITNADCRRLNRVEAAVAGQELRGIVDAGMIDQEGVGRWTTYSLRASRELPELLQPVTDEDKILAFVRDKGAINNSECQALLGVDATRAYYLLKKLSASGQLMSHGRGRWRKYLLR
jgi:predicted HTH transcriptional regulator